MKNLIKNNLFALKQIWKYAPFFIIVEFALCFTGIYEPLVQVYFLQKLIDLLTQRVAIIEIVTLVGGFTIVQCVIMALMNIMNESYFPKKSEEIKNKLNLEYMEKLKALDLQCFDNSEYYDKYTRSAGEAAERPILVFTTIIQFLVCVLEIGTLITLMLTMNPVAIVIAVLNVLLAVMWQTRKGRISYEMEMEKTPLERLKRYFFAVCWGNDYAKEIRSGTIFKKLTQKYEDNANESLRISRKYLKKISFLNTKIASTNAISFGFMYGYFAFIAYTGKITVGSIAALLVAVSQLTQNISYLFNYIPQLYQHSLYMENVFPILKYKPKIETSIGKPIDRIDSVEFRNVSFAYPFTDREILKNISFRINRGEKLAIVGHNGAGKTTIFKLLYRFYDVNAGNIYVNNVDIREYNVYMLRKLMGAVFQDYKLFHLNIKDNLTYGEYMNEEQLLKVLDECGMYERIWKKPMRLETNISKEFDPEGEIFSGGEQQKIVIARTILQNPDVFLMDEPSSALDPMAEVELVQLMNRVAKDKVCILITHRLSNVCDANCILLLEEGEIKEAGTHLELMELNGRYAKMFEIQANLYKEKL